MDTLLTGKHCRFRSAHRQALATCSLRDGPLPLAHAWCLSVFRWGIYRRWATRTWGEPGDSLGMSWKFAVRACWRNRPAQCGSMASQSYCLLTFFCTKLHITRTRRHTQAVEPTTALVLRTAITPPVWWGRCCPTRRFFNAWNWHRT